MPTEEELFAAVDALLAGDPDLPGPAERARLREAAGITQARLAQVLQTTTQTVKNWEAGRSRPRPPRRQAYQRLLEGWAQQFPTTTTPADTAPTATAPVATPPGEPTPAPPAPAPADEPPPTHPAPEPAPAPAPEPAPTSEAPPRSRTPHPEKTPHPRKAHRPAHRPTPPPADQRFENGPLAVIDVEDGHVLAYCVGGLVLDVPAKSLPALIDWTLTEARLGQPRLHRNGRDGDPLLVLTPAALERYGLPTALSDEERRAGRLPDGHKAVRQLTRADWKLTRRGLGPWARIYRPAEGAKRHCVQLCIPAWNALDAREWDDRNAPRLPSMHPADLARYLGAYAQRVMTPRGTAAVTGLELMTALHPPTRAEKDPVTGAFTRALNADSHFRAARDSHLDVI
ncbi:helix-turn-helix domain-containing protein [Streptomyces rochei]|uniref:helix-turn-helix domain-containing protein n=1 Tax=Streptomyces rochei TaxID=1928 RepID=UPI0036B52277